MRSLAVAVQNSAREFTLPGKLSLSRATAATTKRYLVFCCNNSSIKYQKTNTRHKSGAKIIFKKILFRDQEWGYEKTVVKEYESFPDASDCTRNRLSAGIHPPLVMVVPCPRLLVRAQPSRAIFPGDIRVRPVPQPSRHLQTPLGGGRQWSGSWAFF